jgi:HKD family nuclease
MSRTINTNRKILEAWEKPGNSGGCIGVITTSYNFDGNHFEENCLSAFLGLDTEIENDGDLFLYDLDMRLSEVTVMAFVDHAFTKGKRNLRWGLYPVVVPFGIQHAKVSILVWEKHVRVIIGSANITKDGHRINHEIFSQIDYSIDTGFDLKILDDVIIFIQQVTKDYAKGLTNKINAQLNRLLNQAKKIAEKENNPDFEADFEGRFLPIWPNGQNLLEQIDQFWSSNRKASLIEIESPFFDQSQIKNTPYREIWKYMMERGDAHVAYRLDFEIDEKGKKIIIPAPEELFKSKPKRESTRIDLNPLVKDQNQQIRPHHAKSYLYHHESKFLAVIGSSNFTRKGTGVSSQSNIEANIAFLNKSATSKSHEQLVSLFPNDDFEIHEYDDYEKVYSDRNDPSELEGSALIYPDFVKGLYYERQDQDGFLKLMLSENHTEFTLLDPSGVKIVLRNSLPHEYICSLSDTLPFPEYTITWGDQKRYSLQVLIEEPSCIPHSKDLLNLTVDEVLSVLRSNLPLQKAIMNIIRRRKEASDQSSTGFYNPLKEINNSGFILQRTRKSIWLIGSLKSYLESHCISLESFKYRINGPVGLRSVIKLIQAGLEKTSEEWSFILVEMYRELKSIQFNSKTDLILINEMKLILNEEINSLKYIIIELIPTLHPSFQHYAKKVIEGEAV